MTNQNENQRRLDSYSDYFTGKVALVTGASSGIGRSIALSFAANRAKVVVADIQEKEGLALCNEISKLGGESVFKKTNVSSAQDCENLVKFTVEKFGRLDAACNNAGIGGALALSGEYRIEDWQRVIDTNLSGVFYCMRYEIPALLKNGGGSITNISSILGQVGFASASAYTAAKHGVVGLTKTAAIEYAQQGIRINSVGPAFIETPMIAPVTQDAKAKESIQSLHPMNRLGTPQEVADLVLFLSSDRASFLTGGYFPVDGGYLSR